MRMRGCPTRTCAKAPIRKYQLSGQNLQTPKLTCACSRVVFCSCEAHVSIAVAENKPSPPRQAESWSDRFFGPLCGELYRRHLLDSARTRAEVTFAKKLLRLDRKDVLDLAAGFGRHARLLARTN